LIYEGPSAGLARLAALLEAEGLEARYRGCGPQVTEPKAESRVESPPERAGGTALAGRLTKSERE
jgi:hypothetical protein